MIRRLICYVWGHLWGTEWTFKMVRHRECRRCSRIEVFTEYSEALSRWEKV